MVPVFNLIIILLCSNVIVFILVYIILDPRKTDYDSEFNATCTRNLHLFPLEGKAKNDNRYCFCGNEVMRENEFHEYLIVKT